MRCNSSLFRDVGVSPATILTFHLHGSPQAVSCLGIELFQAMEHFINILAPCLCFVWTRRFLFLKAQAHGHLTDVFLGYEAQGPDDAQRIVAHRHAGLHGRDGALEGHVHQQRGDEVVLMMSQGNLVVAVIAGIFKQRLAPVP